MTQHTLPIYDIADALTATLATASRLILTAPTGSGKSTQVPQILLDRGLLGHGEVVVLQPRRLAARLLAARVAEERGEALGATVGYQVRLDGKSSAATRILYVTEGILLRRLLTSPALDGVSAILFDEFHERHVYGDITLARARMLQASTRPDLKLVVMSAPLATGLVRAYLEPCPWLWPRDACTRSTWSISRAPSIYGVSRYGTPLQRALSGSCVLVWRATCSCLCQVRMKLRGPSM